jgi:hypothetical protein
MGIFPWVEVLRSGDFRLNHLRTLRHNTLELFECPSLIFSLAIPWSSSLGVTLLNWCDSSRLTLY